eukprot:12423157-Karenia_brevis.AAC.1
MAIEKQRADGLELSSFINGSISSSSRTELLGLIISLFSPLPLHVALDSAAVLHPARSILSWLCSPSTDLSLLRAQLPQSVCDYRVHPLGKSLAFLPNSDLWHIYYRTLVARGPHTVLLTKTKGHAMEDHDFLLKHPELRYQAVQNDRADAIAKGAKFTFYHPSLVKLSAVLGKRLDAYVDFLSSIFAIIARVHQAAQRLRKSPAFQLQHPELSVPTYITFSAPLYIDDLSFRPLGFKCTGHMVNRYLGDAPPSITGLKRLLTCCLFAADDSRSGLTWLELFLLSIAFCDAPLSLIRSDTARSQKLLVHQLREFAAQATLFLKFALAVDSQRLFAATHKGQNRMLSYGYHN